MGAIPTTMGGSRGAQAQEGSVTVSGMGLTQYLASAQHHGRQRRGTGPPSRAELSPAPLASVPASHVPSAWWDLGTWGRQGGGCQGAAWDTAVYPPQWGPNSGHTVTSTFWITLPKGQRKYPARSQQSHPVGTRASAGTSCVAPSYRATLQGRDPKEASTHQCCLRLSQETHGSPSPSRGDPKFGTHHKKPPQW